MKVAKIEEHLTDNDLNDLIKEHKDSYNIYRRAYLIKMVKKGDTIKKASEIMNVSRKTGERWVKEYNEKKDLHKKSTRKPKYNDEEINKADKKLNVIPCGHLFCSDCWFEYHTKLRFIL